MAMVRRFVLIVGGMGDVGHDLFSKQGEQTGG